ncbi:MAG TPA: cytochrome c oxidase subunit 3 [Acidimicrobiales bacterium]
MTTASARREVPSALVIGGVVWISSELLFFGSLFGSYFTLRAASDGPWPPEGADVEVWAGALGTALLLLSSVTVHAGAKAARAERLDTMRHWLLATIALGAGFLLLLAREWSELPFSVDDHAFGTMFYTLTGFHGLHLLAGLVAMVVVIWRSIAGVVREDAIDVVSYYWHFVDIVWIALFTSVYLAG